MFAEQLPDPSNFASIGWVIVILAALAFGANSVLDLVDRMRGKKDQPTMISPQPLAVELVEELHEQFASKQLFDDHVKTNTERHGQIFHRIDRVEREAREATDRRFTELNEERRETLEKLNNQFTFIRENVAAINRELQIRNGNK